LKKALVSSKKSHATFLYIPETQSSVRSLRMPIWGPKVLAGILGVLVIYSSFSAYAISHLKFQYETSKKDIKALTEINNSQKAEIESLNLNAQKIQKQLEQNLAALEEVKAAVGLEDKGSEETKTKGKAALSTVSQAIDGNIALPFVSGNSYDLSAELSSLQTSLLSLSKKTMNQKTEIDKSVASIKDRLDYLRCVPSIAPVVAKITAGYGYRRNPFTSRGSEFHDGIDFGAPYGTKVVATGDGVVLFAGYQSGYGRMVIISHGYGLTTSYSHNSSILVKKGDKVKRGQAISKVGSTGRSTGAHLHYEVKLNGKNVNPAKYF